jgi:hypothetical protein
MVFGISINRNKQRGTYAFNKIFKGFGKVELVKSIFGEKTEDTLKRIRVNVQRHDGYLRVDDVNGNILISLEYLKSGDERHIYLDVIHELVHVKQFIEGKELFDNRYSYVDRPTEIEAYILAVKEAKRIGLSDDEIVDYLRVEWVSDKEFERLLKHVSIIRKIAS